ncbi:MAG: Cobalamin adenosyltransferase [Firmicutes bacterium ADurb.Bin182]|nr:MAG: Cobalamin adenosyltransferase [Firmicutes bacterium ADurb.Bin182]
MGKQQFYTSLNNESMVRKDDKRIVFRGLLDGVMADICFCAALAYNEGNAMLCSRLQELNECCKAVMSAHVKGTEPVLPKIGGKDLKTLHEMSHDPGKFFGCGHFLPEPEQGLALAWLNVLRTGIRDAERACEEENQGIQNAMNWMSGAVFVMMCEQISLRK